MRAVLALLHVAYEGPSRIVAKVDHWGLGVADRGWKCQYSEGETVLPVHRGKAVLSRAADAECQGLRVWPTADVLAIFRLHAADEVDFDVDLRECRARIDLMCSAASFGRSGGGWASRC